MLFFKKKPDLSQPRPDWPWTLKEGGNLLRDVAWENVEYGLAQLCPEQDSFLILEQTDPKNSKNYWFIQTAISLGELNFGMYVVDVSRGTPGGPVMVERYYAALDEVTAIFKAAFQCERLDLSGYKKFGL